jgi:hypothetical protein
MSQELHLQEWRRSRKGRLAAGELAGLSEEAIRTLPLISQEDFLLRGVEQLSNEVAACALDISLPATKRRLLREPLTIQFGFGTSNSYWKMLYENPKTKSKHEES